MSKPIEDYAIIGDLRSVALISKAGSIDWLCLPDFDSGACFASLLGDESNGHWTIAPTGDVSGVTRGYRPDSLVLETEMATADGTIRIVDYMPARDDNPIIVRVVEGLEGSVTVRSELSLRFDYGRSRPFIRTIEHGLHALAGPNGVAIVSPADVTVEDHNVICEFTVAPGQQFAFQILSHASWNEIPDPCDPHDGLESVTSQWRNWSEMCQYEGPYREAIVRSLITLKSLTFAPTGGICAAATTSLPESIGGNRNWDYRFCWIRDSTFTLEALFRSGYTQEAIEFREWVLRAVGGSPEQLQIMYGIRGERQLPELQLPWLAGYENSAPVRIGNEAAGQFQLDVYGELVNAAYYARTIGVEANDDVFELGVGIVTFIEQHWREPDDGIWEVRGERQHFVHSKVMAWVGIDRIAKIIDEFGRPGDLNKWRALADEIHADICAKGVDPVKNRFVQHYGSDQLDASLLILPQVGFLPPDDQRIINTVRGIAEELTSNGLVLRYLTETTDDGLTGEEGSFVICTFWLVECLAKIGDVAEAQMLFDRMLDLRNDVGLLSEEYDAIHHRMLGNMPQAFSHVGLINAAFALQDALTPTEVPEDSSTQ